ncbi:MAG: MarR family winged helix-turn-helix transcriptional regulator [Caulobacterales bacterium]
MAEPRDRADVEFFTEVGIIDQLVTHRLEGVLPDGLSVAGFGVLNHLARLGRISHPLALAQAFQVSKGAMTNTLQRLEAARFVRVTADPADGRRKRVELTAEGAAAHQASLLAARPRLESLRGAFGAAEFEAALPFLRRLRAWLDAHR